MRLLLLYILCIVTIFTVITNECKTDAIEIPSITTQLEKEESKSTEPSAEETVVYEDISMYLIDYEYESLELKAVKEEIEKLELYLLLLEDIYSLNPPEVIKEIGHITAIRNQYYEDVEALTAEHWRRCAEEYPVATEIWLFLKNELNYSDEICAAILGNIMAEVGGQTLNIQYWLGSKSTGYYGMCQWALKYYPDILNASLQEQCNYLKSSIKKEINTFGRVYKKGFKYEDFIAMTDIEQAALAFAKSYERCGSGSYKVRQRNAIKAYNYFAV